MACYLLSLALMTAAQTSLGDASIRTVAAEELVQRGPGLLEHFDAGTGRFGKGIWIVQDQQVIYPLAVLYATELENNPYYKDAALLDTIMKGGDALIDDADENGQWEFRKKDGSTWGKIHMPWTYSRWARAFALVRDDMPSDRRARWEQALALGYGHIAEDCLGHVHNIPTHHAMGLYIAGKALDRPEWCKRAGDFMQTVVATQRDGGYWSEGTGPVVGYNFVYLDALGTYYAVSNDKRVLPALDKAAVFHHRFTYPNGANMAAIDERNPYHETVQRGNVGFTFSASGWAFLENQWRNLGGGDPRKGIDKLSADFLASLAAYGGEYQPGKTGSATREPLFLLEEEGRAMAAVVSEMDWTVCLSAYTAPVPENRWLQDRQDMLSVFHASGLVLGGGNTKLQPGWITFTVGDTSLLKHEAGDEDPDFLPKGELYHVPSEARILMEPSPGLALKYGEETCRVFVRCRGKGAMRIRYDATLNSGLPVVAHLPLIPRIGQTIMTDGGQSVTLGDEPFDWTAEQVDGAVTHGAWRLVVPACATVHWPALPHNPYRKDGRAAPKEGRIEVRIPFDEQHTSHNVDVEIVAPLG